MEITIARRFCGPPASGNGGYSCGRLAAFVGPAAEITLRAPPPLDTPLRVLPHDGSWRMTHGDQVVAEGHARELDLQIPVPPSWEEAERAGRGYNGFRDHAYDTCFVCGP